MAQSDMKTIKELDAVDISQHPLNSDSQFVIVVNEPESGAEHWVTKKIMFPDLKSSITGSPWTDVTGVLTAGNTSVTISDASILATSTIQVFTDPALLYNSITVAVGSVTLTFDEQQSDVSVKVRIS